MLSQKYPEIAGYNFTYFWMHSVPNTYANETSINCASNTKIIFSQCQGGLLIIYSKTPSLTDM